jgi:hypothetical protein
MRYLDLPFEEAFNQKWADGVKRHRTGQTSFQGDKVDELFQELIDGFHYSREIRESGIILPNFTIITLAGKQQWDLTLKGMAWAVYQTQRRPL